MEMQNFMVENFCDGAKDTKFAKIFYHENKPVYGIMLYYYYYEE